jgi:hypothetical protein
MIAQVAACTLTVMIPVRYDERLYTYVPSAECLELEVTVSLYECTVVVALILAISMLK